MIQAAGLPTFYTMVSMPLAASVCPETLPERLLWSSGPVDLAETAGADGRLV